MAAHTVGSSGIETVVAKESAGSIRGEHLAVKEHGHQIRILGAELHIVGDHDDGHTLVFQVAQYFRKCFLKEAVDTFGRLVQK